MTKKTRIVLLAGALSVGLLHAAQVPAQARTVHLTPNITTTVVSGTVEGVEIMPFHLALKEGQRLDVLCHSRKIGIYFFVKDPSGSILYNSAEGPQPDRWTGLATRPGKYTLGVFQRHPSAHKGQTAFFRLHLAVNDGSVSEG
ncbi:hypothetical protein OQ252_12120 [Acetobacter farinalis]|uniref:Uncharacterized protein n=1 Tax=Acetobacter farinalis TaxID=1260984 RepID=A0ABT3QA19_9PROT|nr:hypothetical protein [Acetobacter farinalis]MCX2562136.1 hypothetical protein [Acetobacter farinalis]NHO30689.1 hypothetical protein [Acetobacter farinalis]